MFESTAPFSMLNGVVPFFIVDDLGATLAFYQSKLGFDVLYKCGGEENGGDYFAIMGRDRVMLMFKAITPEVHPQPNRSRHEWARWDAYIGNISSFGFAEKNAQVPDSTATLPMNLFGT